MMLPEAVTRTRLLVGPAPVFPVSSQRDGDLPPLQPGQPIDGRVGPQSRTGYIVSVAGRHFDFKLPDGARPGDMLRMVYMSDNPRPTFALLRIDGANTPVQPALSDAGKLLAMLREAPLEAPDSPFVRSANPVFASQVPAATQAATQLREALTHSGLFYESHQAQWIMGTRSTEQLQREPQGRLAPNQPAAPEMVELKTLSAAAQESVRGAQAMPAPAASGAETDAARQSELVARSPAHPDTFAIIRQQLSAIESGHVTWSGIVWPGQVMQWQVGDDAPAEQENSEVARTWHTELKLALPNIGDVHARIELDADGARVRIVADSEQHARQLREQAPALAIHFNASGIPVKALEVSHAEV